MKKYPRSRRFPLCCIQWLRRSRTHVIGGNSYLYVSCVQKVRLRADLQLIAAEDVAVKADLFLCHAECEPDELL